MKIALVAVSLLSSALMAATVQAEPAAAVKERAQVAHPAQTKEAASALAAREKRSEVLKRAVELKKKQQQQSAATEGK